MSSLVGLGCSPSSAQALTIIPGVQYPHWTPPISTNAFCIGCGVPPVEMPSIVTTDLPAASPTSTRHEFTGTPFSRTVQDAHSPSLQPFLAPVRFRRSRSVSSSVSCGAALTWRVVPFTVNS